MLFPKTKIITKWKKKQKAILGPIYEIAQNAGKKLGNFINDLIDRAFDEDDNTNASTNRKNE